MFFDQLAWRAPQLLLSVFPRVGASQSLRTFYETLISFLRRLAHAARVILRVSPPWLRYLCSLSAVAAATGVLAPFRGLINSTTVAVALLLVILFVAILWGSKPALLSSVLGMLCFNFFFLPPFHTFTIADPQKLGCPDCVLRYRACSGPAFGQR